MPRENMHLKNLHQWVQSCKPEEVELTDDTSDSDAYGPAAVGYLSDSLGEKGRAQCLTIEQTERLSRGMNAYIDNAPENHDIELAVQLLALSFKADCTRCTNPTCDFRRAANPSLDNVVARLDGFYDPMAQD